jgi:hypothetical protein
VKKAAIPVGLLVLAAGYLAVRAYIWGASLDREGKAYADIAILAIASRWDEKALLDRGSFELLAAADGYSDPDRTFALWRRLGPLKRYGGAEGGVTIRFTTQTGLVVTGSYSARADFLRASALIHLSLVKQDGAWKIAGFSVKPTAALRPGHPAGV